MPKAEKPEITSVSAKGQVVIPQSLRQKIGLKPKTRLLVYGYHDTVIMKKIDLPEVAGEIDRIYKKVNRRIARFGRLNQKQIEEEIQRFRASK